LQVLGANEGEGKRPETNASAAAVIRQGSGWTDPGFMMATVLSFF